MIKAPFRKGLYSASPFQFARKAFFRSKIKRLLELLMEVTIKFGRANNFQISAISVFFLHRRHTCCSQLQVTKTFFPNFIILVYSGKLSIAHCASNKILKI